MVIRDEMTGMEIVYPPVEDPYGVLFRVAKRVTAASRRRQQAWVHQMLRHAALDVPR